MLADKIRADRIGAFLPEDDVIIIVADCISMAGDLDDIIRIFLSCLFFQLMDDFLRDH